MNEKKKPIKLPGKEIQDLLPTIKDEIQRANEYFGQNYKNYHRFRRFIYESALTAEDRAVLQQTGKPVIEGTVIEPYVSRLIGEWFDQDPDTKVGSKDGNMVDPTLIAFLEGYFRNIIQDAKDNSMHIGALSESLSGGFSGLEIWTEYSATKSFDQVIRLGKTDNPTLTYFDPLAMKPHKGDGHYAGKLYPKTKKEFEHEFPGVSLDDIKFTKSQGGFNWSYSSAKEDIILVCEHYRKKIIKKTLVEVAGMQPMFMDEYKKMVARMNEEKILVQPPKMGRMRLTEVEIICRYIVIEDKIISYEETDFDQLPIPFVDGNSAKLQNTDTSASYQFCRPYFYHAMGATRLRNFSMQTMANHLENLTQGKWIISEESLPTQDEYQEAYRNPQTANVFMHKAYKDNDPNIPLPPPREVVQPPAPPEVMGALSLTDSMIQMSLGSYDAQNGITNNQISGKAIVKGAAQSNAAAMMYLINYIQALNWAFKIILHLIPKIHTDPTTLPILHKNGQTEFVKVNQMGGVNLNYDPESLNIRVSLGVSFEAQKSESLQMLDRMMQSSPILANFISTECLDVLLDNVEIRGIDTLKQRSVPFMQQMKQQQQAQSQQQSQPEMMKMQMAQQEMAMRAQKMQDDKIAQAAKIGIDQTRADTERMNVMLKAGDAHAERLIKKEKLDTENMHSATDLAIKAASEHGKHHRELAGLQHKILSSIKQKGAE